MVRKCRYGAALTRLEAAIAEQKPVIKTEEDEMNDLIGKNCVISDSAQIGDGVHIGHNCIVEGDVVIGNDCYIDHNTILRAGVKLGAGSCVGANCILGVLDRWPDPCASTVHRGASADPQRLDPLRGFGNRY